MSTEVELKARAWDLQEALEERRSFESQFFKVLGDLLDIAEDQRSDPQTYINAVIVLKERVSAPVVDGEIVE